MPIEEVSDGGIGRSHTDAMELSVWDRFSTHKSKWFCLSPSNHQGNLKGY